MIFFYPKSNRFLFHWY